MGKATRDLGRRQICKDSCFFIATLSTVSNEFVPNSILAHSKAYVSRIVEVKGVEDEGFCACLLLSTMESSFIGANRRTLIVPQPVAAHTFQNAISHCSKPNRNIVKKN